MAILEVDDITVGYDAEINVLHGVSLSVGESESVALIGANGAGKSTLLKTISGLMHPKTGTITYSGTRIERKEPHQIVERGIVQIPEEKDTFETLSVEENLQACCQTRRAKVNARKNFAFVFEMFPILKERGTQLAKSLSGGERKMLAVGKAIVSEPRMLLLDDISVGLAPKIVFTLYDRLKELRDLLGLPMLVVEQNVEIALKFTERGYVLSVGKIVLDGLSEDLKETEEVRKSYLGA